MFLIGKFFIFQSLIIEGTELSGGGVGGGVGSGAFLLQFPAPRTTRTPVQDACYLKKGDTRP